MRNSVFAVLLGCASVAVAQEQPQAPLPEPPASPGQVIDLATDGNKRMTVGVMLDGKGPYRFVVDTGAERTMVSNELAASLALPHAGRARVHSVTRTTPVDLVQIETLDMDMHRTLDLQAPSMAQAHIGGPGLIGVDTLSTQRVTLDFRNGTMNISPSRVRDRRDWGNDIIVRARSREGRMVIMDATLDGEKVAVILDTGSQASLGNEALSRKLFKQRPKRSAVPVELIDVAGGRMTAIYTTTHALKISGFQLNALPLALADAPIFKELGFSDRPAMLLGMDALALFDRVAIDFDKRTARFLMPDTGERQGPARYAMAP